MNNKLNHTKKNPQNLSSTVTKATQRSILDRFSNWQEALNQNDPNFFNGFPCAESAGGISANTSQQLALQISSNSRGLVFFHIPKFNRPNSPGRGLKIIIDSLLSLSSYQLLVLTDPITYWPIKCRFKK